MSSVVSGGQVLVSIKKKKGIAALYVVLGKGVAFECDCWDLEFQKYQAFWVTHE